MIKDILFIISEGASIDRATNQLSVFNILEDLSSPAFPLMIQKIVATIFLERNNEDETDFNANLVIKNNEQEILSFPIPIKFSDKLKIRSIVTIGGLTVPSPGELCFNFNIASKTSLEYKIDVNKTTKPNVKVKKS